MLQDDLIKIIQEADIEEGEKQQILAMAQTEGASDRVMEELEHAVNKAEAEVQKEYTEKLEQFKAEYKKEADKITAMKQAFDADMDAAIKEEETARKEAVKEMDDADLEEARSILQ